MLLESAVEVTFMWSYLSSEKTHISLKAFGYMQCEMLNPLANELYVTVFTKNNRLVRKSIIAYTRK